MYPKSKRLSVWVLMLMLAGALAGRPFPAELVEFEARIDRLALLAFQKEEATHLLEAISAAREELREATRALQEVEERLRRAAPRPESSFAPAGGRRTGASTRRSSAGSGSATAAPCSS